MGHSYKRLLYSITFALALTSCVTKAPLTRELVLKTSQPVFGRDFYAAQSKFWNVKASIKYPMPPPMAIGTLDNTFGTALQPISTILTAFKPAYYRVHIINTVCVRNHNCGKYEIGYGYSKASFDIAVSKKDPKIIKPFKARVQLYKELSAQFSGIQFIVSPALEHDLSKKSWRVLADAVYSVWPGVQLSNSPDGGVGVETYLGSWLERHGSTPQSDADIVSLDGADATQIDIDAFLKRVRSFPHCKIVQLWTAGDNCRTNDWQDPRVRTHCPSSKTFQLMSHIIDPQPAPVGFTGTQCKKITPFKAPDIWKPLSESHIKPDPRQELPVTIFKGFKNGNLDVLSSNGQRIGSLGYYGTYLDQGYRWYSGYSGGSRSSGYEFQQGAAVNSGSPYTWLRQGGTCKGPFLGGRRQGLMRDK